MKQTTVKRTEIGNILKAEQKVFGNIGLIAKNKKLDMRNVHSHDLGPLP